ncbi:helix-turn-helix domain-containing protein [Actinomadura bangladeshensis]|uniref:ImmA/IrrE family metallo-endopeptidase n=1 Tax=Actinomadura bangladeshensis TaxID=453573 RepID=A0A6L9Q9J9_9ACTN|nr:XRE family transcriptional regulator [Actinomadura bangladeshensis]NEA22189.1 ImmA/IrrE family metallo-endopeptidase [Actinomadura bangladeshensis]
MDAVYGDRLRQARILRAHKLSDVADALGCATSTVSKWESAHQVELDSVRREKVARFLQFPEAFFHLEPTPKLSDSDLLYRAPKSTLKREKDYLREFLRLVSEILVWLDDKRQLPPVKLKPLPGPSDIAEAAKNARRFIGIDTDRPISFLTHPLERAGIVVVVRRRRLSDKISDDPGLEVRRPHNERHEGCSAWVGDFRERPVIMMKASESWERTRWTLAHEIGHLVMHPSSEVMTSNAEEEASQFANEFLAPISQIKQELPPLITIAALIDVKMRWGISLAALVRHLHYNDVIDDRRKNTLYSQLYTRQNPETGRSFGVTEPGWDLHVPERPRLLSAWIGRVVGSIVPEFVASVSSRWPADLIAEILTEQRSGPNHRSALPANSPDKGEAKVIAFPFQGQGHGLEEGTYMLNSVRRGN